MWDAATESALSEVLLQSLEKLADLNLDKEIE
jgi:hypothetical protein